MNSGIHLRDDKGTMQWIFYRLKQWFQLHCPTTLTIHDSTIKITLRESPIVCDQYKLKISAKYPETAEILKQL